MIFSEAKCQIIGSDVNNSLTIRITQEQESALEAFFQINNWTLIKEGKTAKNTFTALA